MNALSSKSFVKVGLDYSLQNFFAVNFVFNQFAKVFGVKPTLIQGPCQEPTL
jgi:hypothetical protein